MVNNTAESGFHSVSSEVDSKLILDTDLVHTGSLTFSYSITTEKSIGSLGEWTWEKREKGREGNDWMGGDGEVSF